MSKPFPLFFARSRECEYVFVAVFPVSFPSTMSDAEKSEELTALVTETLKRRGVLNDLKAKMRAEVYLALEEQRADEDGESAWSANPSIQHLAADSDALEALRLVYEFLSHYGLTNTRSVLEAECPLLETATTENNAVDIESVHLRPPPELVRLVQHSAKSESSARPALASSVPPSQPRARENTFDGYSPEVRVKSKSLPVHGGLGPGREFHFGRGAQDRGVTLSTGRICMPLRHRCSHSSLRCAGLSRETACSSKTSV